MVDNAAAQPFAPASAHPPPSTLPPPPPAISLHPATPPPPSAAPAPGQAPGRPALSFPRPALRLTSEYDSESQVFLHRASCRLFDGLAKLKLSFLNNRNGEISSPLLRLNLGKRLSVDYDVEAQNALVKGSFDVGESLQFQASRDLKEQQGEVSMTTTIVEPSYKLALTTAVPVVGLPKATFQFPTGEVSIEEKEDEKAERVLTMNGILKGQALNGVYTAQYEDTNLKSTCSDKNLKLRYCYKDEEMSFIPEISLPYNAVSLMFKRRFSPSDKLSYCYHFHSNDWNAVYKRTVGEDLKFKAGYDSEVRVGWASLWVGDEEGKTKAAPMKMKVQFMLQVPQDCIENSVFMFRVKKRWDF
ncbi:hypothetical protein Taro_028002 [Colocasia esculenta]|uniref:Outer envelope pore protein 37, chloroplastic n=1 Tax=Colocasia esculenta TaxID=4460 RepID=A0A843VLT5_COLES|nr:hypothetical protein [Colocasia esculenta]